MSLLFVYLRNCSLVNCSCNFLPQKLHLKEDFDYFNGESSNVSKLFSNTVYIYQANLGKMIYFVVSAPTMEHPE